MNKRKAIANTSMMAALGALPSFGCASSGPGSDFDRDDLKDSVEDRNGNFEFDPGETDFRNPDTDGDGLCDGQPPAPLTNCKGCEDCNGNGFWEPCLGETAPLNDDTNNNGVKDGDDPEPLAGLNIDCSHDADVGGPW